jgi:spore coat polysaccharide biosynthesis protein SpsF
MNGNQFKTDQEEFWAGAFGNEYVSRNTGDALIASNISLFAKILAGCCGVRSLIEFGANIGLNLRAIHSLAPHVELDAIEINDTAVGELRAWRKVRQIHHGSILDFRAERTWDAVLIKGVLIHINPDYLPQVYEALFRAAKCYIVLVEYYNPTPVEVAYRGHAGRLFKRDFAGELMEKYPELRLVDYGFVYHRDPVFPQDDITWFVLEKRDQCR